MTGWILIGNIQVYFVCHRILIDAIKTRIFECFHDCINYILTTGGRADSPGQPEDKDNFGILIRELRRAFDTIKREKPLLITAAVSAGKETIDKAYPVTEMAEVLDFIGVMSYDYHGW